MAIVFYLVSTFALTSMSYFPQSSQRCPLKTQIATEHSSTQNSSVAPPLSQVKAEIPENPRRKVLPGKKKKKRKNAALGAGQSLEADLL